MTTDIKAPQFPESISEGTIATWHKKVGDAVSEGETLLEIETDKVLMEVPAVSNGVLMAITKKEGDTVKSMEIIGQLEAGAAPAAISAPWPMVMPHTMVALEPMETWRLTRVSSRDQSVSVCGEPSGFVARGNRSFVNITPCPMKHSSSIVTPSQMKVCDEILQRSPMNAPFWISTNAPIREPSPTSHP